MTQDGININQRDIVFIPFPYSELTGSKKRPVLILSGKEYNSKNNNFIVCALTSNPNRFDRGIPINNKDLELGHLDFDSVVTPCKVFNPHKNNIIKTFGRLDKNKTKEVIDFLKLNIELD